MKGVSFPSKNPVLLLCMGALGGTILTALIGLGVWYAPFESRDASRTLSAIDSATANMNQIHASSSRSIRSDLPLILKSDEPIDEILRVQNVFDQKVALYSLLAVADEEQVIELLDQAINLKHSPLRDSALDVIFSKYADIDPVRALGKAQELGRYTQEQLIDSVFHQWAKSDLDAALASAQSLSGEQRETASRSILNARDDLSLDRLLGLADELQNVEYRNKFTARLWRAKALDDPRSTWQSALQSMSNLRNMSLVLTTIAETWIEQEGLDALDEVNASTISEYHKMRIYQKVLGQIAEKDLEEAVAVAARLKLSPSRFSPTSGVVSEIFSKWAEEEPYQLFGLADSLDQRFVSIAKHQALAAIARESPQEAVSLLAQVDNPALVMRVSANIATQWAATDPKSSLEWYMTSERSKHDPALRYIMRRLTEEDAHNAFKIVVNYPGKLGTLLTNSFFEALVNQDGVDAKEFISLLDDDQRQVPVTLIGQDLARSDIDRALELEKTLPESERLAYRKKIISAASFPDPFLLFENIDQLPSTELQSLAALQLLMSDKSAGVFSEKQLKYLRSRLDADGQRKVNSVVVIGSYDQ